MGLSDFAEEEFYDSNTFFTGDSHCDGDEVFQDASGEDFDVSEDYNEEFVSTEIFFDSNTDFFAVDDEYTEGEGMVQEADGQASVPCVVGYTEQVLYGPGRAMKQMEGNGSLVRAAGIPSRAGHVPREFGCAEKEMDKLKRTLSWHSFAERTQVETGWWTPQWTPLRFTAGVGNEGVVHHEFSVETNSHKLFAGGEGRSDGMLLIGTEDDEICEEFDFRQQEIDVPEWAVALFSLPHAGKWTVYDIAGYDPIDREAAEAVFPEAELNEFDFRQQEIDVPDWAVDLFGLPHAGIWTVYEIAEFDPMDREAGQPAVSADKRNGWIKKLYKRSKRAMLRKKNKKKEQKGNLSFINRFSQGCFGCATSDDCDIA